MEYAIIAAGEGSRLKSEGWQLPKPLVTIGGVPLIDRLIGQFTQAGAHAVHVIINAQSPELADHLQQAGFAVPVHVLQKTTPSSLHSFHELLQRYPHIRECCLATTDTVFQGNEFCRYVEAFQQDHALDALMAVTPYIDDESPLYVAVDDAYRIGSFSDIPLQGRQYASGGIYCLRRRAIDIVGEVIATGVSRMRNFQRALVDEGLAVAAFPFGKIIDVDHVTDIDKAEAFILTD
ncbi:nucleotidyltransferase family protein [Parapedobacter koreensis]|uniref:MobA-like NTP transferase domain-containing protein n=1 Tax=Parapedobacter koreensis TaxID=332977 RepID=A0A1H7F931_9SPHI|nr:NDP-sugar synthase [Parapedobacter koreensis]SEK21847.1 MobA-like NTP transferase domain-containing protein [Parapedobacter koreensis]